MLYASSPITTRADLTVDTVYVHEDTSESFVTPDGVGLVFYETEEEAFEATGAVAEDARLLTAETFRAIADE